MLTALFYDFISTLATQHSNVLQLFSVFVTIQVHPAHCQLATPGNEDKEYRDN